MIVKIKRVGEKKKKVKKINMIVVKRLQIYKLLLMSFKIAKRSIFFRILPSLSVMMEFILAWMIAG